MQINENNFKSELSRIFKENGLSQFLNAEKSEKFLFLTKRMLEENEKYNLTAITEPTEIIAKHYADSAMLALKLAKGASLADIGCGAGFPTLPLAIVRDDLKILAIDSTAKRIAYVKESAELLGLTNVSAMAMRAEEGGANPEFREKFDYATARAVANLRVLSELAMPYVKLGGYFIAMKGKNGAFELAEAKRAIATLGGTAEIEEAPIKNGKETEEHVMIKIKKRSKTPANYPRPYAQISKKPL